MSLARVQERYRELNGDHPMSEADDEYVRSWFVEVDGDRTTWRSPTPDEIRRLVTMAYEQRGSLDDYDIVVGGQSLGADADLLAPLAAAGATWWQESCGPHNGTWSDTLDRVRLGPPPSPAG